VESARISDGRTGPKPPDRPPTVPAHPSPTSCMLGSLVLIIYWTNPTCNFLYLPSRPACMSRGGAIELGAIVPSSFLGAQGLRAWDACICTM
jgi:hypothetical protein